MKSLTIDRRSGIMGQYHMVVNLDKHEYLYPHQLGDGLKLWEQAASGAGGVGSALIALLAVSNGRGGGDFADNPVIGSWGGDRIVIIGDYAERGDLPESDHADVLYMAVSSSAEERKESIALARASAAKYELDEDTAAAESQRAYADALEAMPEFTDATEKIRKVLEAEEIATYAKGDGWITRGRVKR